VTYDFKNPQQAMQDIKTGIREGGSGDAELDALVAASRRQYEQRNGIGQSTAALEAEKTKAALMEASGKAEIENQQKINQMVNQKTMDATDSDALLKQAEPLIQNATHSGFGNLVDRGGAFIGVSPQGAAEAAQLKIIGGNLVSKMPKMSGPQSDKDVQLYKEMAGSLGDPTVPVEQKLAAIETLKKINKKYTNPQNIQNTSPPANTGGWSIRRAE
jgi:hypothetical protein